MTEQHDSEDLAERRPLGLTLLTGLYSFFFLLTFSTIGHPLPFMGRIYTGSVAQTLVFIDSLFCLYLVIGLVKRQYLTWFLLIGYNPAELENFAGESINQEALLINNIIVALTILLLTQFIYRHKGYFTNRRFLLF
jgi:hypothetical protein